MKNLLLASVAVLALSTGAAFAQDNDAERAVGGTAGGVTGAVTGGLIFGPIGAIIGGFTGAVIGSEAVSDDAVEYVRVHPTEPVVIEGDVDVGYIVPDTVELHVVENEPDYGYFYTDDRVYFVKLSDRTVVYSPGVVVAGEE
jgi:hypothetical protein